jgi:hypothetical protein
VIVISGYILLTIKISQPIPGATAIELVGRCDLVYIDTRLQPFVTIVLNCPGVDSMRLWPLPIKQPWSEDWWENKPEMQIG